MSVETKKLNKIRFDPKQKVFKIIYCRQQRLGELTSSRELSSFVKMELKIDSFIHEFIINSCSKVTSFMLHLQLQGHGT